MKEEIEVGEYIKDIFGRIGKVNEISCGTYRTKKFGASSGEIVKHSHNLINLIEVEDYVNGVKVIETSTEFRNNQVEKCLYMLSDMETGWENTIFNEHIKTIVTHEQFASMQYNVEEEQ